MRRPRNNTVPTSNSLAGQNLVDAISVGKSRKIFTNGFEVWAIGIVIVIGGDYFAWNSGLTAGFGSFLFATFISGTGYIALILCTSDMLSALPFSGGAYGIVRCTIGFFPGFLVGCSEALEYIIYTALSSFPLGLMVCNLLNLSSSYQPVVWFLFYAIACFINIKGGAIFWRCNNALGIVSVSILLLYCFGCLKWTAFVPNAYESGDRAWFIGDFSAFMRGFPLSSWFFVGVESVCFTCNVVENARNVIPRASVVCILTLFFASIFVIFVYISLPAGSGQESLSIFPLNFGFSLIFDQSKLQLKGNKNILDLLSLPAIFATGYGFIFAYGQLLHALAQSGMLPQILRKRTDSSGTPSVAILVGSLLSYLTAFLFYFLNVDSNAAFNICMLSAYVTYCTQCYGFYVIKTKFQSIKGAFVSPIGIYGAIYACLVFLFGIISIVFFQKDNVAMLTLLGMWICMSIYYFAVAKHHQRFSYDEQQSLFVAHVINFNRRRSTRRHSKKSWAVKFVNALSIKSRFYNSTTLTVRKYLSPIQCPQERRLQKCGSKFRTQMRRVSALPLKEDEIEF